MYYTYIIYSSSTDRYYVGHTSYKPEQRLDQHNNAMTPSTTPGILPLAIGILIKVI